MTEQVPYSITSMVDGIKVFFSSSSLNKVSKKEVSNKSDTIHSTSSNDLVPNYIDNDSSIHKTLVCENSTSEKGNNSTVIVINRPKRTDNSSTGERLPYKCST